MHEVSEAQDTPSISLFELPVAGVAWMAQVFPLRPSARVELSEELSNQLPTAAQELAEVQVMPSSLLDVSSGLILIRRPGRLGNGDLRRCRVGAG